MKDFDYNALIEHIRKEVVHVSEVLNKPFEGKHNPEFSKGYWTGKESIYQEILRKMVEFGAEISLDLSLIYEAENLISKHPCGFYCGHELNRQLHHYVADFKRKDYVQAMLSEICIRRGIVKARLEAAKLSVDRFD